MAWCGIAWRVCDVVWCGVVWRVCGVCVVWCVAAWFGVWRAWLSLWYVCVCVGVCVVKANEADYLLSQKSVQVDQIQDNWLSTDTKVNDLTIVHREFFLWVRYSE